MRPITPDSAQTIRVAALIRAIDKREAEQFHAHLMAVARASV